MRLSSFLIASFTFVFLSLAFCLGVLFFVFRYPCVDFSVLTQHNHGHASILYDDQGKEWGRFAYDKRDPVSISIMPPHLLQAFIAAEDWEFFSHNGLAWRAIVRSFLVNVRHGRIVQGGSTITQQLVKMLFYDNRRTFKRKIKEQFLTLLVERQYTKEHILETYLNHVYFGSGMYGVSAAAHRYWGKTVAELEPQESALLAAIVCSPGHYSPLLFPYSAVRRRNVILGKMKRLHFLSDDQYRFLRAIPLNILPAQHQVVAPYVKEYIRTFLEDIVGKEQLYRGGLVIKTTLNKEMQLRAQKVFAQHFAHLRAKYGADLNGGLMSIAVHTGGIKAMVGGVSFSESQFNRALHARRQQGSVFKPLVYAAALEKGLSLLDTAVDEPFEIKQGNTVWQPRNHSRTYNGKMTLARALSYSHNTISAKVIVTIGPESVVDLAKKCRLSGTIPAYPSLALGCLDSSVAEVVGMFNIFANDGVYCQPYLISAVKDAAGKTIFKHEPIEERVLTSRIASQIGQALTFGIERKKKPDLPWIDSPAMTKTGTTNDARVCWFAGSTPEITTVVNVACDDNRPMGKNVYPVHTAYPLWLDLHTGITTQQKTFTFDPTLRPVVVDWKTGEVVASEQVAYGRVSLLV